jgi:hypothetical protein
MTAADIKRARQTHAIVDLGGETGFEELLADRQAAQVSGRSGEAGGVAPV